MEWHKANLQAAEDRQRELNNQRRSANRQAIKAHQNHVLNQNQNSRQYLKQVSQEIMQNKTQAKYDQEVSNQVQAANSLNIQKNQRANSDFNRQAGTAASCAKWLVCSEHMCVCPMISCYALNNVTCFSTRNHA